MFRIILEGICGSGKTTLYKRLQAEIVRRGFENIFMVPEFYSSPIHINTQPAEREKIAYNAMTNVLNYLDYVDKVWKNYNTEDLSKAYHSVIDSFYLVNAAKCHSNRRDFFDIESRIRKLGFVVVWLKIPEEKVLEQSVILTKKYRNSNKWNMYLEHFGNNDDDVAKYLIMNQNRIKEYVHKSTIDILQIDTGEMKWDDYVHCIMERCLISNL